MVAAGVRTGMRIVVGGVKVESEEGFDDDQEMVGGMDVQVPMLNSTVKLGKEMEVVARGRANVKDIFLRWFIWKEYEDEGGEEQEGVAVEVDEPHGEAEEQVPLDEVADRPISVSGKPDDDPFLLECSK